MSDSTHGGRTIGRVALITGLVAASAFVLVAMLSGSAASASSATAHSAAKPPFKILFIGPFSGALASAGKAELAGLNAGVKTVNARKGILGQRVTVKWLDDAGVGAKATSLALQELAADKYNMVICGIAGAEAVPCTAAIAKQKILQMAVAADDDLGDPAKSPNTFQTVSRFGAKADAVILRLKKDKKTKVALVVGDTASGRAGAEAFQASAKRNKIQVTDTILVPAGTVDATPQIQKAQSGGAQGIVMMAFTPQNIPILRARAKLGWSAPAYLDPTACASNYGAALNASELNGVLGSAPASQIKGNKATKTKSAKLFYKNVAVYDPQPVIGINAHTVTYNAVMFTRAAATKAKSTDPAKMIKAMPKIKKFTQIADGIGTGKVYASAQTHALNQSGSDFTWFKLGKLENGLQVPAS